MIERFLACPRCHARPVECDEKWVCGECGPVGTSSLGFPDFLADRSILDMAAGGRMDLRIDEELAAELHGASAELDFEGLSARAAELRAQQEGRSRWSAQRRSKVERFEARIGHVNAQGNPRGGESMLMKLDCKLEELGWPSIPAGVVLEAGGGPGLYLPAFSRRFEAVVFVDASLVNVVLAAKLITEQGLRNVACVRADVMALPLATGGFDLVHQNGVVEHVSDPEAMAREGIRVRHDGGYYVCVSPNRMSLAPEPHSGIPAYGFIPERVREPLMRRVRGLSSEESATDPRSLGELRRSLQMKGEEVVTFFLPRHLPFTARQTLARRLVRRSLDTRFAGGALDRLLNVVMLPVVPQHIAIARPRPAAP